MDLLNYFNEIKKLKEFKNDKKLDLLLVKIKQELQELLKIKQKKLINYEDKCDYKIQRKQKKLLKNKQILNDTIKEYGIKENIYKFPEELIRINEFHNQLCKNLKQLQEESNLVNQKILYFEKNITKYNSLLVKNKKSLKFYEKYLFQYEKEIPIVRREIENYFGDQQIYNSLFFDLCTHRIKILQKNLNTDLKLLEIKFDGDMLDNINTISELKLNKSKLRNDSDLHNLKLENIQLNIDLAIQNKKCLTEIFTNKKKKLLKKHNEESYIINTFIKSWEGKINLNKIRLTLEKHIITKFLKYLEKELIFQYTKIKDNKNCIYNSKLEIEKWNNIELNIYKKIENKRELIQEVILEKNKIIKETTKKYKYYMNYYTHFIKNIKVSILVLSRDIEKLKSLNLEKKYCSNENKKIGIYNKLIQNIENDTISKD